MTRDERLKILQAEYLPPPGSNNWIDRNRGLKVLTVSEFLSWALAPGDPEMEDDYIPPGLVDDRPGRGGLMHVPDEVATEFIRKHYGPGLDGRIGIDV